MLPAEQVSAKGIPKYKYSAGLVKSEGLIGFTGIRGAKTIVLLEGVLDARYLNSYGFKTASVGGSDLSLAQINLLERSGAKEVLLAFDMDDAGRAATANAGDLLSRSGAGLTSSAYRRDSKIPMNSYGRRERKRSRPCCKTRNDGSVGKRGIFATHMTSPPNRGLDNAIQEAATGSARLNDALDRRFFLSSLCAATGLTEEELSGRLRQQEQVMTLQRVKNTLQMTLAKLQSAAGDDVAAVAEHELEQGSASVCARIGAAMPEPYLLERDFERDIRKTPAGLQTGYYELDAFLRIPQGALTILAGRPGHGKTTLLLNLFLNFLSKYPDKHYLFSYEEARQWLALKLIMILAGEILDAGHNQAEYLRYLRNDPGRPRSFSAIDEAVSTYSRLTNSGRLTIVDQRPCAEDLASTLARVTRQGDVGAIIIDYIQKIPLRQTLTGSATRKSSAYRN